MSASSVLIPALTIRYRDAADLLEQEQRHAVNALARAIHQSANVRPLRVPVRNPYATPKGCTAGSDLSAKLLEQEQAAKAAEIDLAHHHHAQRYDLAEKARKRMVEAQNTASKLRRELEQIDTSPPSLGGVEGMYVVVVPRFDAKCVDTGEIERHAGRKLIVDARQASAEAQAWLREYRLGGSEAMPYWHCKKRQRYYERTSLDSELAQRLRELLECETCQP